MSARGEPARPTARRLTVTVSHEDAGRRLDHVVTARLPDLSRSHVQRLIRDGSITIGGRAVKTGAIVAPGMTIAIDLPEPAPSTPQPEALPLPVLYDDDDLVVGLEERAGGLTHAKRSSRWAAVVPRMMQSTWCSMPSALRIPPGTSA